MWKKGIGKVSLKKKELASLQYNALVACHQNDVLEVKMGSF